MPEFVFRPEFQCSLDEDDDAPAPSPSRLSSPQRERAPFNCNSSVSKTNSKLLPPLFLFWSLQLSLSLSFSPSSFYCSPFLSISLHINGTSEHGHPRICKLLLVRATVLQIVSSPVSLSL
ncbi:hypothetical protein KP509_21G074000 [Ceratopteris richardii]|uniref:Uncharacterized protein n=1 Tax=Ceratopteris richardii TaxID=49495 RepID=A0A8T2SEJ2_CERRI|nr:hypothetical protein KP509_21G074000 [Ceratopteris richardii]